MDTDWATALLDPTAPAPPGLRVWNGSDPTLRLAVHRNNILVRLVDGLAQTYPVVQQLVGEQFFRAMAAVFVRQTPPTSAVLSAYGGALPQFLARFPPAMGLAYLPDLARLEWARQLAAQAADVLPWHPEQAAQALAAAGSALAGARLAMHPYCQLVASAHAAVSLWAAHQTDGDPQLAGIALDSPESGLVVRSGGTVLVVPLTPGDAALVDALLRGQTLAGAAAAALALDPGLDLAASLRLLASCGACAGLITGWAPLAEGGRS